MLSDILHNVVVQILLGIGAMVFLISLGDALRGSAARSGTKHSREAEIKLKGEVQKELASMREEMKSLKSTLLEHSMSLDTNVQNLQHRLEHIERTVASQGVRNNG